MYDSIYISMGYFESILLTLWIYYLTIYGSILVHNIGNVLSVIPIEEHSGSTYIISNAVSNINAIILPSGTSVSAVDVINSGLSLIQPSISYTAVANTVSFTVNGVSLGYNIDTQINIVRVG